MHSLGRTPDEPNPHIPTPPIQQKLPRLSLTQTRTQDTQDSKPELKTQSITGSPTDEEVSHSGSLFKRTYHVR